MHGVMLHRFYMVTWISFSLKRSWRTVMAGLKLQRVIYRMSRKLSQNSELEKVYWLIPTNIPSFCTWKPCTWMCDEWKREGELCHPWRCMKTWWLMMTELDVKERKWEFVSHLISCHLVFCVIAWLYAVFSSSYSTRWRFVKDDKGESRLRRDDVGRTWRGISFLIYSAPLPVYKISLKRETGMRKQRQRKEIKASSEQNDFRQ